MAISNGDKTWRTTFDPLYLNGELVKTVRFNGALVYPEEHTSHFKFADSGKVERSGLYAYFTQHDDMLTPDKGDGAWLKTKDPLVCSYDIEWEVMSNAPSVTYSEAFVELIHRGAPYYGWAERVPPDNSYERHYAIKLHCDVRCENPDIVNSETKIYKAPVYYNGFWQRFEYSEDTPSAVYTYDMRSDASFDIEYHVTVEEGMRTGTYVSNRPFVEPATGGAGFVDGWFALEITPPPDITMSPDEVGSVYPESTWGVWIGFNGIPYEVEYLTKSSHDESWTWFDLWGMSYGSADTSLWKFRKDSGLSRVRYNGQYELVVKGTATDTTRLLYSNELGVG